MFTKGFDSFAAVGDKIQCTVDGVIYTAELEQDLDISPYDYEEGAYNQQDCIDWEQDKWFFSIVVVYATVPGISEKIHLDCVGAVDTNFAENNDYLKAITNEILEEHKETVWAELDDLQTKIEEFKGTFSPRCK